MDNWQIFISVMVLYWSDIITGPILYVTRKIEHWFSIRAIKRDIEAMKEARKKGTSTDEMVEAGILHKYKSEPYEPPTKLEEAWWWTKSILWYRLLEHPEDFRYWLIHKYQRAKRGWSNRDTWGFDYFLATVIIGGLKHLKKTKHGIPNAFCNNRIDNSKKEFKKAEERWDKALDCMIKSFETSISISEDHWFYQNSNKYDLKQANYWRKVHKKWLIEDRKLYTEGQLKVMTKKECKEYEKGWELFRIHFNSLWD